ncbi:hypothetical protein EV182_005864, partial [Spiromyces aspiralis]
VLQPTYSPPLSVHSTAQPRPQSICQSNDSVAMQLSQGPPRATSSGATNIVASQTHGPPPLAKAASLPDTTTLFAATRSHSSLPLSATLAQGPPPFADTYPARVPRALRVLDLGFCKGVRNYALQRFASKLSTLTALNLAGGGRSDIAVAKIAQYTQNLTRISLSWSQQLTVFGLGEIVRRCPQLEVLDLTHCMRLEDQAITMVAANCQQLRVLSIAYCINLSDACVHDLLRFCHRLKVLNTCGCMGISEEAKDLARSNGIVVDPFGYLPFYDA